MTDVVIDAARQYAGSPADRIFYIMETVMVENLARYDLPVWQGAQSDNIASRAFKRVLKKHFAFAAWMFSEAGFSREQADISGRMMVIYMMGESTLIPDSMAKRKEYIKLKHALLTASEQGLAEPGEPPPHIGALSSIWCRNLSPQGTSAVDRQAAVCRFEVNNGKVSMAADPHLAPKRQLSVLSSQTLTDGGCPYNPRFLTFDTTIVPARYTTLVVKHAGLVPIR